MIANGDLAIYVAKQSARGVYPAAPTYMWEVVSGDIVSKPTIKSLNIADGRIFGSSKKCIGMVETGGEVVITGQPKDMGAAFAYAGWTDTPAGGADPYTHTMVPPTSFDGFPRFCAWRVLDDQISFLGDLEIGKLDFEIANTDDGYLRLRLAIVGMAKEKVADAPAYPAQESDTVHWLNGGGYHNLNGDSTNQAHIAVPTDLATLKTALESFKTKYNAHLAVASGRHHKAADAVNTLAFATPLADLPACIAALTEIRADLIAHEALTTTHYFEDTTDNNPSAAWIEPCVTLEDCLIAAQDLLGAVNTPGCYNRHVGAQAGLRNIKFSYDMNPTPYQGESVTAYVLHRKPGTIGIAVDMLQEDFRLINLAKYGDPAPAVGTEITTEIQKLGFNTKFIASVTGNERSIALAIPEFDLDSEPLASLSGDPEGNEPVVVVGGEATGTAPIATVTVINDVATY
jgi:hypothetical protein